MKWALAKDEKVWHNGSVVPLKRPYPMRIAIYARVSRDDKRDGKKQDPENQLRELRAWCDKTGHTIVHEYIDRESGRKDATNRKQFAALFEDAHKRQFDCVLCWALDRLTREGMVATVMYLQRLAGCGVSFHSYTEPHLSTDNELLRDILLAVMASLAKMESKKISERTRAGMERARVKGTESGKPIGRPRIDPALQRKIAKRLGEGLSAYAVAKQLGVDAHTVARYRSPFVAAAADVQ
jgi:DNA invertase Pin-like site-specific DNA recombinase